MNRDTAPNILIWRNGKLGNTIVAIPFILELRKALPYCRIAVVVETLGAELLANYPEINQLIIYNKRREHKGLFANLKFIKSLRDENFTHAFLLKRFFRNSLLSFLAGIPNRFGFQGGSGNRLLTRTVPYCEDQNIVKTNLSLLSLLGLPVPEQAAYRFYTSGPDQEAAMRFLSENGLAAKKYVAIHCGGETVRDENVSPEMFARLAQHASKDLGLTPVFINARGDEAGVLRVRKVLEPGLPYVVFAHDGIRVNAEFLRRAALFIGNNSGQAHLAALVDTPSLVVYRKNAQAEYFIRKWLPWQEKITAQVVEAEAPMENIVREAMEKIGKVLKQ